MALVLLTLTGLGLLLVLVMAGAQHRALGRPVPATAERLPAVSVLKPLKGVDAGLEANIASFLELDYPEYELILGVQDPTDPAVDVAHRVAARSSRVPVRVVVGGDDVGANPKVNNLAAMLPAARHSLILISDSNVTAPPGHLRALVAHLLQPEVAMVTALIRGVGGRGLGGGLEQLQLNTYVMGGVAAATSVFGRVAAVGKSMLLRRCDLDRVGGFPELGRYLAEDQICGEKLAAAGARVVVAPQPIDNVLGALTVRRFADRHLRWARIRRHVAPWGYAAEILANPVPPAAALVASQPGVVSAAVASLVLAVLSGAAWTAERRLGVPRRWWVYPPLELIRGVMVAVLWPVPFLSRRVAWRGRRYRLRRWTLLEPEVVGGRWSSGDDGSADEVAA